MIFALGEHEPEIDPTAWVAPTAVIIGKVRIKAGASIWFGAVLRGDSEWIEIGEGSNVQENAVLHTDPGCPLTVGANCTIGHTAIVHGCTIGDGALVGMGATVLNRAVLGAGSLLGAGALLTEGKEIEPGKLAVGAPAKAIRDLPPEQMARQISQAGWYNQNAQRHRDTMRQIG